MNSLEGEMENLTKEVLDLIESKREGSYWDFKREWYKKEKIDDLLLDIICMSNNLVDRDCYIIIGVDEESDCKIKNVSGDKNRKNTQNLTGSCGQRLCPRIRILSNDSLIQSINISMKQYLVYLSVTGTIQTADDGLALELVR